MRRAHPFLQTKHGFGETRRLDGLHEIVERAALKRLDGVFGECRNEHQVRTTTNVLCGFDAGLSRHLHVEEADVGLMHFEQINGLAPVTRLRHDFEFGPRAREHSHQRLAQQRFIVGNESSRAHPGHAAIFRLGNTTSAHTPCGSISVNMSCASPPNASFRRSRSVESPVPKP